MIKTMIKNDKLNEAFGISTSNNIIEDVKDADIIQYQDSKIISVPPEDSKGEDDEEFARQTVKNLITNNEDAMEDLLSIAKASEHPKAYEVYGQLVKTQADLARTLVSFKRQRTDKNEQKQDGVPTGVNVTQNNQNNIIFNGSTAELLKLINKNT